MPNSLKLKDHLPVEEIEKLYKAEKDLVRRSWLHIVWLKCKGMDTPDIHDVTGYHPHTIRSAIKRYNTFGPQGLLNKRALNCGVKPLLNAEQCKELERLLESAMPDGSPWTGPAVARWIAHATQRDFVHPQRGWDYMQKLKFSAQTPRPAHIKTATDSQKDEWKKKSQPLP